MTEGQDGTFLFSFFSFCYDFLKRHMLVAHSFARLDLYVMVGLRHVVYVFFFFFFLGMVDRWISSRKFPNSQPPLTSVPKEPSSISFKVTPKNIPFHPF